MANILFLFCLAELTCPTYKNAIGPKNDNMGLLTCLQNTDQDIIWRKMLEIVIGQTVKTPDLLVSRAQLFCTVIRFERRINFPLKHLFRGKCQAFLISAFCTNFVFLYSQNFNLLHCLGSIDMHTFLFVYC